VIPIFNSFCLIIALVLAEHLMRSHLERTGVKLIEEVQRYESAESMSWYFENILDFPPDIWAFYPGILFGCTRFGYSTGSRVIFLNGVGRLMKWSLILLFRQGRPFWVSDKIHMWHCPTQYGFPSGHAMLNLLCVGSILDFLDRRIRRGGKATVLLLLVARNIILGIYIVCVFGRLVLGTHFLHSLLMGAACASLLLQLFTSQNVNIIRKRSIRAVADKYQGGIWFWLDILVGIMVTFAALGLFVVLIRFIHDNTGSSDPLVWNARSIVGCGQPLDTSSVSPGIDGIIILMGCLVSNIINGILQGKESILNNDEFSQLYGTFSTRVRKSTYYTDGYFYASSRMCFAFGLLLWCPYRQISLGLSAVIALSCHGPDLKCKI